MNPVQEWQNIIGVTADGAFGPATLAASMKFAGVRTLAPKPLPQPVGAVIMQGGKYPVREIVVHCTATPAAWMARNSFAERFAEIRRWHMKDRGWSDIGYHHVIDRDGAGKAGRAETTIGAGVMGHNSGVIHISLIGGADSAATDQFSDNFTPQQDAALRQLIREISGRTAIEKVTGHNEYAAKACPGFMVAAWMRG